MRAEEEAHIISTIIDNSEKEMKLLTDSFIDINVHIVYTMYIQKESEAINLCMHK